MKGNKKIAMIILGLIAAVLLFFGVRALLVLRSVSSYKSYWDKEIARPIEDGEFVYVALGDSAAQSIGASSPMKGYVGLVAKHVNQKTSKKVHIINLSVTGAKVQDAIDLQIPALEKLNIKPDLVTIDIGCNDMKTFEPERFEHELNQLAKLLPRSTYILEISPYFKDEAKHANQILRKVAEANGLRVAPLESKAERLKSWVNYGGDFFHPSNHGYAIWAEGFIEQIDSEH